jgi:hypothetical protein
MYHGCVQRLGRPSTKKQTVTATFMAMLCKHTAVSLRLQSVSIGNIVDICFFSIRGCFMDSFVFCTLHSFPAGPLLIERLIAAG